MKLPNDVTDSVRVWRCGYPGCDYAAELRWYGDKWVRVNQYCGYHRELQKDDPRYKAQQEHAKRKLQAKKYNTPFYPEYTEYPTSDQISQKVGKCKQDGCEETASAVVYEVPGGYRILNASYGFCEKHNAERIAEDEAEEKRRQDEALEYIKSNFESNLHQNLIEQGFPLESVDKFLSGDITEWVENNIPRSQVQEIFDFLNSGWNDWRVLVMTGDTGRGKTALATLLSIMLWRENYRWDKGRVVRIEDRPYRDRLLKAEGYAAINMRERVMDKPKVLVWDEAGTKPTDYGWSLWREMLEYARKNKMRLIVCSNRTLDGLRQSEVETSDDGIAKVFSRLRQGGNYMLEVAGVDMRDPGLNR